MHDVVICHCTSSLGRVLQGPGEPSWPSTATPPPACRLVCKASQGMAAGSCTRSWSCCQRQKQAAEASRLPRTACCSLAAALLVRWHTCARARTPHQRTSSFCVAKPGGQLTQSLGA